MCYVINYGNFTNNSPYANNTVLLLSSLAANVALNGGFYTTSIGQGADRVHGLVLCRTDASEKDCLECVNNGIRDIITKCPNQKKAISWGRGSVPPCTIRYANYSMLGKMELDPSEPGYNTKGLTDISVEQFDKIWSGLVERVGNEASMGSEKRKFATGETNLTSFETIYLLMQCTPDLSQTDCRNCLWQAVGEFRSCCLGMSGGYTLKPSCWFRWDLYPFYQVTADPPAQPIPIRKDKKKISSITIMMITVVPVLGLSLFVAFLYILFRRRKSKQRKKSSSSDSNKRYEEIDCENTNDIMSTPDSLQFDIETIRLATNNFSDDNKLGEGGFGLVYKGTLPDGSTIAVKRWSRNSRQGEAEFKNEVQLVAMLQHRNLARLLGFCLEERERLLIYEFVPNSSLDYYIFDPNRRLILDWKMRVKIIEGIARGILYLHEDSHTRIIHRDLKASNILLDEQMNSKISDFGTARLSVVDQSQIATRRIVGTIGYMPPEYAMHGRFSIKSDVFSFGVLVLEIMSGQKVTRFHSGETGENLLTYMRQIDLR
ncbi:cysteine-rich receptor-like protein kinase 11 isoform X2 [Mercurialis annua]|uniref:cysteine-rich receptor-like protein kinase 11 isoform X2 n=1 Tax=Mercurialis annua TaxID=3986 RepID=UPI0021609DE3|nr:cysteine-rich receptor-like protein kinase 11 isoform X2 [Mercurialis annua]